MIDTIVSGTACPRCQFELESELPECPACGVVFARLEESRKTIERPSNTDAVTEDWGGGDGDVWNAETTIPPGGFSAMSLPEPLQWAATLNTVSGMLSLLLAGAIYYFTQGDPVLMPAVAGNVAAGALAIWVGWATRRLYPSARVVLVIGSIFSLLAVPVGTLISILLLRYLFHPGMLVLFSGKLTHELTPVESEQLMALQDSRAGIWFVRVTKFFLFFAVLGIVAALAFGGLGVVRGSFKQTKAISDLKAIDFAVRDHTIGHVGFPPTQPVHELARGFEKPPPIVDPWGQRYVYEKTDTTFRVGSAGPDGKWEYNRLASYEKGEPAGDDLVVASGYLITE